MRRTLPSTSQSHSSLIREFFTKRFFFAAVASLALGLLASPSLHAQKVINGTAGFGTGLQTLVTNVTLVPGDGATVDWGDGSSDAGLLNCGTFFQSNQCTILGTHIYMLPGTYSISISYMYMPPPTFQQPFGCGNILKPAPCQGNASATAIISPPGKFVILSIGDSVASGEGDPVVSDNEPGSSLSPNYAFWDDTYSNNGTSPFPPDEAAEWPNQSFPCHRSLWAGPAQAAAAIGGTNLGITVIHYACSGAEIGPGDTAKDSVQDAAGQLKVARERLAKYGAGIDILLISAGANSVYGPNSFGNGFGDLVNYCLSPSNDCDAKGNVKNDLTTSFNQLLPQEYKMLAMEINCVQPSPSTISGTTLTYPDPGCTDPQKQIPKLVLITEYMDPTHDQNGNYTTINNCPAVLFKLVDQPEWQFFYDSVVGPLNADVDSFSTYAALAGLSAPTYPVTGIGGRTLPDGSVDPNDTDDFLRHGACAGSLRWVDTGHDSETLMGQGEPPGPNRNVPPAGLGLTEPSTLTPEDPVTCLMGPGSALGLRVAQTAARRTIGIGFTTPSSHTTRPQQRHLPPPVATPTALELGPASRLTSPYRPPTP